MRDKSALEKTLEVLLISGPSGVGKSTIAFELTRILKRHGVSHAFIEGDALDFVWPAPSADPGKSRLTNRNLTALSDNYRALGYTRLILTGVYLADPAAQADIRDALPNSTFRSVLLRADDSTRISRLGAREIGTGLEDHVASTRRAAEALEKLASTNPHVVDTDGRNVLDVATEVAAVSGWLEATNAD